MRFHIGIEDLAANALIECLLTTDDVRFITYKQLEKYGSEIVRFLNNKGNKAILVLSRERTKDMLKSYSDFFEEKETEIGLGIKLKDEKPATILLKSLGDI